MEDKVTRGKAKALLVKIKRGTAEAPPMPEVSVATPAESNTSGSETDEQLMERLVAAGLEGDMEEINSLENKALRGKIKAAIVKAKRKKRLTWFALRRLWRRHELPDGSRARTVIVRTSMDTTACCWAQRDELPCIFGMPALCEECVWQVAVGARPASYVCV